MESKKRKQTDFDNLKPDPVAGPPKLDFKQELDIFDSIPNIQSVIEEKETLKIPPVTALMRNSRVIDFLIPGFANYGYTPNSLRVNLKLMIFNNGQFVLKSRVQTQGGEGKDQNYDPVSVINNIAGSMFARVMFWLNDVEVFSANSLHSYRSWIEQSLAFSSNNKYAVTRSTQGFVRDSGTDADSVSFIANAGPFVRSEWTENGNILNLYGKLSHDCLNMDGKILPPGTIMRLRLERASDEFCLMWDEKGSPPDYQTEKPKYTLEINSIHIEIDRYRLAQEAIDFISNTLSKQTARYYLTRVEMREQFIPLNSIEWTMELVYGLQIVPLRLFFGLCPVLHKNGTMQTNPLCFKNHGVEEIVVKINEKIVRAIKIGWKNTNMLEAYIHLLKALHILDKQSELDMTMEDWAEGPLTLFGVDLSRDGTDASDPIQGAVSISLRFNKPTKEALSAIVYGCYQGTLFIHGDKTVECYDSIVVAPSKRI